MALGLRPLEIVAKGTHPLLAKAPHWIRVILSDVANVQNGFAFKSSYFDPDKGVPLIRIRDISRDNTEHRYWGEYDDQYLVKAGEILVGMDGDFAVSRWTGEKALLNQRVCKVTLISDLFDERFLYLCLQPFLDAINAETSSVTVKHLSSKTIEDIPLPLPSLMEQQRVVSKVEELFSALDKAIESLKTARAQLNVYRQAVLKHAFEGKLTAQWREENKDKLETPEQLLTRIKQEREARYERQLQEWKAAAKDWEKSGKLGRKPSKPRPISHPEPLTDMELTVLPEISSLWRWTKIGDLFSVYVGATPSRKNQKYWNGAISWLSSGEVCFTTINKTNETITREGLANTSTEVHPIGTVMLGMIGEGKTRGQAAITNVETCHNQNTAAIRVSESGIRPEYVYYYLLYRYEHTRRVGSGNNQKALNKERVSNLPIPLSSLDEQAVLVQALEKNLSVIEQIDSEISSQLASAHFLRQSILKKAFSGQLVAQDPSDEPASVLLERIRDEREKTLKNNTPKKTKRRKTAA